MSGYVTTRTSGGWCRRSQSRCCSSYRSRKEVCGARLIRPAPRRLPAVDELLGVGADGAHGGWVAVSCYGRLGAPPDVRRTDVVLCRAFTDVVELRRDSSAPMAVDIPMGLLETVELRPCDAGAQELLGKRRSTVFAPPSRPLLKAASYSDARGLVEELRKTEPTAKSLSAQAFGIAPKMKQVDDWLRQHPAAQDWLYECHPELSFRAMADGRVLDDKKTVHGQVDRLRLVLREFPDALDVVAATRLSSRDAQLTDILDAYAALDSALHVAAEEHEEIGGETDDAGLIMRMVF
jgi:predicted RNase H-like nuclease